MEFRLAVRDDRRTPEMKRVHLWPFRFSKLPIAVIQFGGLISRLGIGDLDVIQGHDGASSKGLADTIKNTIILMVLPMDLGGGARIPTGDSLQKNA